MVWGQTAHEQDRCSKKHLADWWGILHGGEFKLYGEPLYVTFSRSLPLEASNNVVSVDVNGHRRRARFI